MKFLGIDVSTKTGVAFLNGDEVVPKLITFPKARGFERVELISASIGNLVEEWKPDLIVIEGYGFASKTLICSVEIGTAIRVALRNLGHKEWWTVTPSSLKLWTAKKGNAQKPAMAAAVKERWGFESKSDDIIDAYALARFGEYIHNHGQEGLPKGVTNAS